MRNICIALTILLLAVPTGCEEKENHKNTTDIQSVSYGTSFGECLGYCKKSITVTPSAIVFTKQGWDLDGQLPDSTFQEQLSSTEWNDLVNNIDMDEFMALDPVIGCPDCADGGAEWIEIIYLDQTYKVTFEYFNAPDIMTSYIDTLRSFLDMFE